MTVIGGIMVPHPPLIVPQVGRGEERAVAATGEAFARAAEELAQWGPETIVLASPHAVMYGDYFHVSPGKGASGDFRQFGVRDVSMEVSYDREFVERLCDLADGEDFPLGTLGDTGGGLDHGTLVPLYFIRKYRKDVRLVRLGLSGLSLSDHYRAGQLVARAAGQLGRRVAFVASGDLSHKLTEDGPYGFAPQGPEYDRRIMEVMGQVRFGELFGFGESFCDKAAECGHRSFVMMAGAFDRRAVEARALSHEGPFGVGYGVCVFRDAGPDDSRNFLEQYEDGQREACARIRDGEDPYAGLARRSLEHYVRFGRRLPLPKDLPEEMTDRRAGAFVSIHKQGALRGCIGTISPVCENVAREILQNAVSAGTGDPRFPEVREEELDQLVYSVDVLGQATPVDSPDQLDVKRYGVIASKGGRRGILLPDLEGVDTVEEQIAIARRKAGIGEQETGVKLERFEVVRHGGEGA